MAQVREYTPINWGVDSEYGILENVLLAPPDNFCWGDGEANTVIRRARAMGLEHRPDDAREQHSKLVDALRSAQVQCHFLDPIHGTSSQVFTRDPAFMTPWGMVMGRLERSKRRGEHVAVEDFVESQSIEVCKRVSQGSLEGGDVHVAKPGKLLIGYTNFRTFHDAAKELINFFEDKGWSTFALYVDPHYLHLDLLFNMISEDTAIICTDVLYPDDIDEISRFLGLKKIIPTSYHQAMHLCGNVVALGDRRVIVSSSDDYGRKLCADLRDDDFHTIELDLSQFTYDGGGPHCLTMPLRRQTP